MKQYSHPLNSTDMHVCVFFQYMVKHCRAAKHTPLAKFIPKRSPLRFILKVERTLGTLFGGGGGTKAMLQKVAFLKNELAHTAVVHVLLMKPRQPGIAPVKRGTVTGSDGL